MTKNPNYYQEALHSLFSLILSADNSPERLRQIVEKSMATAQKSLLKSPRKKELATNRIIGAVFYRWFRDPLYLNPDATPKALRIKGKRPSLENLIRAEAVRGQAVEDLLQKIIKLRLVKKEKRSTRYLPVSQVAVFQTASPELIQHIGASFARLLSTVQYNTRPEHRDHPLVERAASVEGLPKSQISAFREFSRAQAQSYLATIDDWLERRRVAPSSAARGRQVVPAGVHIYAFLSR
jgi:hypothetical protein